MLKFANPEYLYLLLIIPLMIGLKVLMDFRQRSKLRKYGDVNLLKELMPEVSAKRRNLKFGLLLAAIAAAIFMIARPQEGIAVDNQKREGIEALICIDVSNSMYAEDVQPSRLDKAKMLVSKLVDGFDDDKVGLVVFAGQAFIQLPITTDFVSAKMFLDQISPASVQDQGTNIQDAITLASNSFTTQKNVGKAIIIITDGEDHEGGAIEAAKAAAGQGMTVFVLGVGLDEGAPFKIPGEGGDYKKDEEGNVVVTMLNQDMCRELAQAGGGAYIHVDNSDSAQEALAKQLDKLAKAKFAVSFAEYNEQFAVFGWIALLLLLVEMIIMEKKNPLFKNIKLFKK
ncbi:MAG: VWA domain-containing protein [Bacteroidales bacterium]|nr:VWA domain-containing protein [Bacteroidales bacterium]